jgi:hypothetical protein
MATVGVEQVEFGEFVDGEIDRADRDALTTAVSGFLEREQPDVVVTMEPGGVTAHPDHMAVSAATQAAFGAYAAGPASASRASTTGACPCRPCSGSGSSAARSASSCRARTTPSGRGAPRRPVHLLGRHLAGGRGHVAVAARAPDPGRRLPQDARQPGLLAGGVRPDLLCPRPPRPRPGDPHETSLVEAFANELTRPRWPSRPSAAGSTRPRASRPWRPWRARVRPGPRRRDPRRGRHQHLHRHRRVDRLLAPPHPQDGRGQPPGHGGRHRLLRRGRPRGRAGHPRGRPGGRQRRQGPAGRAGHGRAQRAAAAPAGPPGPERAAAHPGGHQGPDRLRRVVHVLHHPPHPGPLRSYPESRSSATSAARSTGASARSSHRRPPGQVRDDRGETDALARPGRPPHGHRRAAAAAALQRPARAGHPGPGGPGPRRPKVCRHLHIPLQAGDDQVLEAMHRPYRIAEFLERVEGPRPRSLAWGCPPT